MVLAALATPVTARPFPWGRLTITPIVVSPPLEYIPADLGPPRPLLWHVPVKEKRDLTAWLDTTGLSKEDVSMLAATARPAPDGLGLTVSPQPRLIRAMPPAVRARIYVELGTDPRNFDQQSAFRFYGDSIDEWLGTDLPARVRALVDPLVYRHGDFMFFADVESVRSEIGNESDIRQLVKRLLRQATVLVSVQIDASDPEQAIEYWGRGGRKTDIRPLLESIANGPSGPSGQAVDLAHLLPELPRRLLYRYPKVTMADLEKPQLANCFWTALNFFNHEPDDRYLDPAFALSRLREDYYLVHDGLQLGDIVAYSDPQRRIVHVAVYIADELIFTKNGYFSLAPWTILPMDRLNGHFAEHAGSWKVTYYRRKDQ